MSAASLEAAIQGKATPGTTVLRGARPPALDGPSLRAATTPLMAAFMVAAAVLRTRMEPFPLDLIGLALRTLAVAFTLRASLDVARLLAAFARDRRADRHALAWDDEALLLHSPEGATCVQRQDVAAVVVTPARLPGEAKRRARPVWLALWPRTGVATGWVTLPAYFAQDSDVLHARLARWLGPTTPPEPQAQTHADKAPPEGAQPAGAWTAGRTPDFWKRGPWGWLLVSFACLDVVRVAPAPWDEALRAPALAMAAISAVAPLAWVFWLHRRTNTPGKRLLSLTSTHVVGIGPRGSVALRHAEVVDVTLAYRARWAPFDGAYAVRSLEIRGKDGSALRFDSSLLDAPVEVVAEVSARLAGVELQGP